MKNALPLFYYPTTWVYVDDDKTLLRTMGLTLSKHGKVELFSSPKECLNFFQSYQPLLAQHSFLKSITNDENYGLLQRTPMDFDVTQLVKLTEDEARYSEITVMIIDYHMPEMDGFTLAKQVQKLSIQKILLTGNREDSKAIEGFNNNLIQRFLQKGMENVANKLLLYLKELSIQYFRNISSPLLLYLEAERRLPLSDPTFIDFFETHLENNNIVEYYLIDKEGSFLCMDAKGHHSCLVVRSLPSLNNWLKIYEDNPTISKGDLIELKEHKKLPFFGIGKEAWQIDASEWIHHLYPAQVLEGREKYFLSKIDLS